MKNFILVLTCLFLFSFSNAQKEKTGYAEVNGIKLYYEVAGSGIPVVLIHGFTFDSRCWRDQVPALKKKCHVVSYDLRGFGRSSMPEGDNQYSHTKDLISLLDYLEIDKAVILGHSYGGRLAIDFTLNYPERVIGLILPEAAMDVTDMGYEEDFKELIDWLQSTRNAVMTKGVEYAKDVWLKGSPFLPAIVNKKSSDLVKMMVNEYSGWHWLNKNPHVGFKRYSVSRLEEINVPTLILYGEISPIGYYRIAQVQHEHIPNSKLVKISNAAHALNIENPSQFNSELKQFLKENFFR